mgnify:FL=1
MFDDEIDDDDDLYEGRDYKMAWQRRNLRYQEASLENWIYVGVDVGRPGVSKVGKTTGEMNTRSYGSQNPWFAIKYAFKLRAPMLLSSHASDERVRLGKERNRARVSVIEKAVKEILHGHYRCIHHYTSGKPSEWFEADADCMAALISAFLIERFPNDVIRVGDEHDESTMLMCWKNEELLKKSAMPGYQERGVFSKPLY